MNSILAKIPRRLLLPALAVGIVTLLPSCIVVEEPYYRHPHYYGPAYRPGVYAVLPPGYGGAYYFHEGRYYYGGRHEVGRFYWNGRYYDHRYSHNGRYYYGGRYAHGHEERSEGHHHRY